MKQFDALSIRRKKVAAVYGQQRGKKGEWREAGIEREDWGKEWRDRERGTGRKTDSLIVKLIKLIIGR